MSIHKDQHTEDVANDANYVQADIRKGDRVRVSTRNFTVEGTVDTAVNWKNDKGDDWYVEFHGDDGLPYYVKQQYDHADVEKIDYPPCDTEYSDRPGARW